jgi:putative phosphotransacetylase
MTPSEAEVYGVADGWTVRVKAGGDCGVIFENVAVLVSRGTPPEFHITAEEAAAAGVRDGEPSAYVILSKALPAAAASPSRQACSGAELPAVAPERERGAELEPEKLITEETVRQAWKQKAVLIVNKGVLCTPLARDAIKELGVQAIWR